MKRARPSLSAVAALAFLAAGCVAGPPGMQLRAPERIVQSLAVVDDIEATATLVLEGQGPAATVALARGADGVTFSGFIDASAGNYVLEIVFTGVPQTGDAAIDSRRHFLGRLTSDSFTVVDGASTTPTFSNRVDTIGRADDGGDEDEDGLGFLDELLLNLDTTAPDTDEDGVLDGADCDPGDQDSQFVILDGGNFEDCDGDGFRAVDAPLGDPGDDCNDEDAAISPAAIDDCITIVDEDCSQVTCPVSDEVQPDIDLISPEDGAVIGCNAELVLDASDLSGIAAVSAADDNGRSVIFVADEVDADGDGEADDPPPGEPQRFRAITGFGGAFVSDGPLDVTYTAVDGNNNTRRLEASYQVLRSFPAVELSGAAVLIDGAPVELTVTPTGERPLSRLELRAAPRDPVEGLPDPIDITAEFVVATLDPAGGTVTLDPDVLVGELAIYPVAVDDVGNVAAPSRAAARYDGEFDAINTDWACDGTERFIPAVLRRTDIQGAVTMRTNLDEAIAIALGFDATAYLSGIVLFGVGPDGTVDLTRNDGLYAVRYVFMTPAEAANGIDAEFVAVTWASADSAATNPQIDPTGSFEVEEIVNVDLLLDSPEIVAGFRCPGGAGPQGTENDVLFYRHDTDIFADKDIFDLDNADGVGWFSDAIDLQDPAEFCYSDADPSFCPSPPTQCTE